MSREKIKAIATAHFNEFGYEGTKISQIAEEAGICKQSLAYHFSNKRVLFQEVYKDAVEDAVEDEVQFIEQYFEQHAEDTVEQQLQQFLTEHKEQFQTNPSTHLLLTISFLVPDELYKDVTYKPYRYIDMLTAFLEAALQNKPSALVRKITRNNLEYLLERYQFVRSGNADMRSFSFYIVKKARLPQKIWQLYTIAIQSCR